MNIDLVVEASRRKTIIAHKLSLSKEKQDDKD